MFLLDTNHCSDILKGDLIACQKLSQPGLNLATCVVVMGELIFMVENSKCKTDNLEKVHQFLSSLQIYNVDSDVAKIYGEIKARLIDHFAPKDKAKRRQFDLKKHCDIYDNDLWIASVALKHQLIALTKDNDFEKIKNVSDLKTDSWV